MELIKEFPDKNIIILESSAKFIFKNCPSDNLEPICSEKVEISEIGAKWWMELHEWEDYNVNYHRRAAHMKLEIENATYTPNQNSTSDGLNVQFQIKVKIPPNLALPVKSEDVLVKKEKKPLKEKGEACRIYIYCNISQCVQLANTCIRVNRKDGNDYEFDCRVFISTEVQAFEMISGTVGIPAKAAAFGSLLDSGDYSDFTFIVSGKHFKVHKLILSLSSEYFDTMFKSAFKEKDENNSIIKDQDPAIFLQMLEFIYKGKLPENFKEIAMDLYEMAHIFGIKPLLNFCLGHIHSSRINEDNVLQMYNFAVKYELSDLFDASWNFLKIKMLKVPQPRIDLHPLTLQQIQKYMKLNEEYEEKIANILEETKL